MVSTTLPAPAASHSAGRRERQANAPNAVKSRLTITCMNALVGSPAARRNTRLRTVSAPSPATPTSDIASHR